MRLDESDWARLALDFDGAAPSGEHRDASRLAGAVLDLADRVLELHAAVGDLKDREAFNVRLEALRAAREHVSELPSEKENQRGYRDHAMRPPERIAQELAVARFLLSGQP